MALPTNTVTVFSAIGNREDLADVIYDITPTETPFLSMANKGGNATSTLHEWQTNTLEAAAANRQLEGDNATANTFNATTRLNNKCQISRKTVTVSGTQRAMNSAGRADEYSYQVANRGKELKRDIEYALVRNQASSAGGIGTARSLASLESWLSTNKTSVGTGTAQTTPGYASGDCLAPTDSTVAGTFVEANLKDVIQKCWTQGGDPGIVMCGPFNKQRASTFTGIATQYRETGDKRATIIGAAAVYISDFGEHRIVANRFQRDQTVFVLDMDYWEVSYLRNMKLTPLAKTGDADNAMLVCEYTLQASNQAASGKITDCTVS